MRDLVVQAAMEPTRREILHLIAEREISSSEIAAQFAMSPAAVSQHLRLLREAGLVILREEGTRRLYRADQEALTALLDWLNAFWSVGLSKLRHEVETGRASTPQPKSKPKHKGKANE